MIDLNSIQPIYQAIADASQSDVRETDPSSQLYHRLKLVENWDVKEGYKILEIGCGQGETTIVLAAIVGELGNIVAIDKEEPQYGNPPLDIAHSIIKTHPIGNRIEFRISTDVLDVDLEFPDQFFDLVVLSHCSWYFPNEEVLSETLRRSRRWSKKLGFAEWNIVPSNINQTAHMVSSLVQAQLRALRTNHKGNVQTVLSPSNILKIINKTGWEITRHEYLSSSTNLWDGKENEIHNTQILVRKFLEDTEIPLVVRDLLSVQIDIIEALQERDSLESLASLCLLAE